MHVDRGERVLGLDHVEFDQGGEAGEGEEQVGLGRRVAAGVDVPVGDRLVDQPLDEGPPLDRKSVV